jgi:hypothetical protein
MLSKMQRGPQVFDYPLFVPNFTLYEDLGIEPEATMQQIQDAINERKQEYQTQAGEISKKLYKVYQKVQGLQETEDQALTLKHENPDFRASNQGKKSLEVHERLDNLRKQAVAENSEYMQLRDQLRDLTAKEENLNNLPLSNPTNRLDYDRANPPLELLKLAECTRNDLFDRGHGSIALTVLRDELSQFLAEQGEVVFHPSDLTRADFSSDFSYVPLLDGVPK